MVNRAMLISLCTMALISCAHAQAVQFAIVNGKIITCAEAVKFRDGRLAEETAVFLNGYDTDKAARQQAARERLKNRMKALDDAWAKTNPANRDALLANSIGLVLSIVGTVVGERVSSMNGISETDKQAAKILADRSAAITSMLTSAGLGADISPADLAGLPIAVIGAIGTPAIGYAALAYGVGSGVVGVGFAGYDYWFAGPRDYRTRLNSLKESLNKLIDKSLDLKLADLNRAKNEIDSKCK